MHNDVCVFCPFFFGCGCCRPAVENCGVSGLCGTVADCFSALHFYENLSCRPFYSPRWKDCSGFRRCGRSYSFSESRLSFFCRRNRNGFFLTKKREDERIVSSSRFCIANIIRNAEKSKFPLRIFHMRNRWFAGRWDEKARGEKSGCRSACPDFLRQAGPSWRVGRPSVSSCFRFFWLAKSQNRYVIVRPILRNPWSTRPEWSPRAMATMGR